MLKVNLAALRVYAARHESVCHSYLSFASSSACFLHGLVSAAWFHRSTWMEASATSPPEIKPRMTARGLGSVCKILWCQYRAQYLDIFVCLFSVSRLPRPLSKRGQAFRHFGGSIVQRPKQFPAPFQGISKLVDTWGFWKQYAVIFGYVDA